MTNSFVYNIATRLMAQLGGDFQLAISQNGGYPSDLAYNSQKCIGVIYPTNGDFRAIEGSIAVEGGMMIDFLLPTDIDLYSAYTAKIEALATAQNMIYNEVSYTDDSGAEVPAMSYVLQFNIQRPTSNIETIMGVQRQRVVMQISFSASPNLAYGNACYLEIYNNGEWQKVSTQIQISTTSNVEMLRRVDLNSFSATHEAQYSMLQINLSYLYNVNDPLHFLLEGHRLSEVNAVYEMRYTNNSTVITFLGQLNSMTWTNVLGAFQRVDIVVVKAKTDEATATYTLTMSPADQSAITVSRYGINIANGETIYAGDILVVTATVGVGYTLTSLKANGTAISNGGSYTVSGDTLLTTTVTSGSTTTYTLSIIEATGSTISVKSGTTVLTNGAIILDGEVLTITCVADTGFLIDTITVNDAEITSGYSYTVDSNTAVKSVASLQSFIVAVDVTIPDNITTSDAYVEIYKISDYYGTSVNTKILDTRESTSTAILYGDTLKYIYTAPTSLQVDTFTVNGTTVLNNAEVTATSNISVAFTASKTPYTLSVTLKGISMSITRDNISLDIDDPPQIYEGDVLTIESSATIVGWNLSYIYINGTAYDPVRTMTYTVSGNTTITSTAVGYAYWKDQNGDTAYSASTINFGSETSSGGSIAQSYFTKSAVTPTNWTFTNWLTTGGTSYSADAICYEPPTTFTAQGVYTEQENVYIQGYANMTSQGVYVAFFARTSYTFGAGSLVSLPSALSIAYTLTIDGVFQSGYTTISANNYQTSAIYIDGTDAGSVVTTIGVGALSPSTMTSGSVQYNISRGGTDIDDNVTRTTIYINTTGIQQSSPYGAYYKFTARSGYSYTSSEVTLPSALTISCTGTLGTGTSYSLGSTISANSSTSSTEFITSTTNVISGFSNFSFSPTSMVSGSTVYTFALGSTNYTT